MGHDYTLSTFLRQTPNSLLKEYFGSNGTRLSGVDFDALKKTEYSPVLEAIDKLDNGHRDQIEQDFQDVFLLADKPGTQIIIDLADLHGLDIADALEAMDNHYHRAMWLFLNRQHNGTDLFDECSTLAQTKFFSFSNSKRRKNLPKRDPKHDDATLAEMSKALRAVYREQGRGHRCSVEYCFRPNPDRHCFFAYPEDYSTSELQYDGDDLRRQRRKSVFQIAFMYRSDEGVLEIGAPGGKKDANVLQEVFCRYALGMDRIPPPTNDRCFELNGLKKSNFSFPTDPADGIDFVKVVALRMNQTGNRKRRITFEHDASGGEDLHTWIKRALDETKLPLRMMDVTQARIRVVWKPEQGKKPRTLTFTLTAPDSMSLKDLPHHQTIRGYLKRWKIAP